MPLLASMLRCHQCNVCTDVPWWCHPEPVNHQQPIPMSKHANHMMSQNIWPRNSSLLLHMTIYLLRHPLEAQYTNMMFLFQSLTTDTLSTILRTLLAWPRMRVLSSTIWWWTRTRGESTSELSTNSTSSPPTWNERWVGSRILQKLGLLVFSDGATISR